MTVSRFQSAVSPATNARKTESFPPSSSQISRGNEPLPQSQIAVPLGSLRWRCMRGAGNTAGGGGTSEQIRGLRRQQREGMRLFSLRFTCFECLQRARHSTMLCKVQTCDHCARCPTKSCLHSARTREKLEKEMEGESFKGQEVKIPRHPSVKKITISKDSSGQRCRLLLISQEG